MKHILSTGMTTLLLIIMTWLIPTSSIVISTETPPAIVTSGTTRSPSTIRSNPEETKPLLSSFNVSVESAKPDIDIDATGEVYFTLGSLNESTQEWVIQLARLPGACIVGLVPCPEPEILKTPFTPIKYGSEGYPRRSITPMDWSPDGNLALVFEHANVSSTEGIKPTSPSRIYVFNAIEESWTLIYESNTEILGSGISISTHWSPDGKWIAFNASTWTENWSEVSDELFILRPDGSGLEMIFSPSTSRFGWIGNEVIIHSNENSEGTANDNRVVYRVNPESKAIDALFSMDFFSMPYPSPNGELIAFADQQTRPPIPIKKIQIVNLKANLVHSLGTYSNQFAGVYPVVWSRDSEQIAFHIFGKMYLSAPDGEPQKVFQGDYTFVQPRIDGAVFSPDGEYLLMEVFDGRVGLVAVSTDEMDSRRVSWPGQDISGQPSMISWKP